MPSLTVRDLDEDLVQRLHRRAAAHGRSAEAEHQAILREALAGPEDAADRAAALAALDAFRRRIAGRGLPPAEQTLAEVRAARMAALTGTAPGG